MSRRKMLLLAGMAILALLLAFGCSLLPREDSGTGEGWYIKLRIQAPAASKGITVTDFDVTGLKIEVRDPEGEVLKIIDWAKDEGSQDYDVPVAQPGEYQIEVTHFGERDGEQVQASESATFKIQAMKITVVNIVPGCIGVIRVEGGGALDPNAWMYGFWVRGGTMGPDSYVAELRANGTYTWWGDYFASREEDIVDYGTWWVEGRTFHSKGVYGESAVEFTKKSDDEWEIPGSGPGSGTSYRRGTEPGGWVFDQTPISLSLGDWQGSTLAPLGMDLYRFEAPDSAEYVVECTPFFSNAVYAADQRTKLADEWESSTLSAGQIVYIIVDSSKGAGTYALRVGSY